MGGSHWSVTDCPPEPAGDRRGVPAAESRGSAPAAQADSGRTDGAALLGCVATELPGWRGQLQARATRPAGGTGVRSAPGEAVPRPLPVSHTVKEAPGPPARKSAGRGPAPGFPLQRPACPSRPLRPVPRVATQQTRGLARAPPGPDQGHAEQGGPLATRVCRQLPTLDDAGRPSHTRLPSGRSSPATGALSLASTWCPAK